MLLTATTIVTAFYPLYKSKYDIGKYRAWIKNFCKFQGAIVIFTTEVFALELYQWRKPLLHLTQIIVRPFDSFAMTCASMISFWQKQHLIDPEKNIHSHELYAMWALKQELVRITINSNKFQSKFFVWCDIGIHRYSALNEYYLTFPSDVERLCIPGRMAFLEVDRIPESYVNDWIESKPMTYPIPEITLGAGCIAGDAEAWTEFGEAYKEMLKEFALRGWFAGKETNIFFAILMEKKTKPFRLFHAKQFGNPVIPGIEWMSFPPMLGGSVDAEVDMRFEPDEKE